ncbi:MAG: serine--tRNA ligase, partial [Pseudomonadota bacterium]
MFDIKLIRENPADFDAGLARRGLEPRSVPLLALDESRRAVLTDLQAKQEARNEASKKIGQAKGSGDDALARTMIETVSRLKQEIQDGEDEARRIEAELENALLEIPNLPHTATPDGQDESQNVERRRVGEPQERNFPQKEHFDIGEGLGLLDFDAAARMSGARFAVLRGALARLERALA